MVHEVPKHYHDTRLMDLLIDRNVPWAEGNIMKYVFRWREKDGLKDLYKSRDYLDAVIANEELKQAGNLGAELSASVFQVQPHNADNGMSIYLGENS